MTEMEFESKLAELDRLLNDPEVQMDPHRVWSLLAELSAHELRGGTAVAAARPEAAAAAAAVASAGRAIARR